MEPLRAGDPREVGPYRLEGWLGGGGMGRVYLGRSPGGRPVAVKVVRPEFAGDARFRERFAREVAAARRVGGFYTAQVVDADPEADPPWLVTAYVPGPSLHEAVARQGPLPATAIGVLGAGLAEGLAAIHACGLVHRDLKPGNVILAADGPRVIDFGIAHAMTDTHTRSMVGTPPYMSPEQALGRPVGPPSDVFSLGSVLVFAAAGRSPFGTGSPAEVGYRVVHAPPDLMGLDILPDGLAGVMAACLSKTPEARPGVTELLDRIAAFGGTPSVWLPPQVVTMISQRVATVPDADAAGGEGEEPGGAGVAAGEPRPVGGASDGGGGAGDRGGAGASPRLSDGPFSAQRADNPGDPVGLLLDQALELIERVGTGPLRAVCLARLARSVAPALPERAVLLAEAAERQVEAVTDIEARADLWAALGSYLVAVDPDRALRLVEAAERTARGIADPGRRGKALRCVVRGMAAVDGARAERVARSIPNASVRAAALADVAEGVAECDPRRAVEVANTIPHGPARDLAMKTAAEASLVTGGQPQFWIRMMLNCLFGKEGNDLLARLGGTIAAHHPALFRQFVGLIQDEPSRTAVVAQALGSVIPERAVELALAIPDELVRRDTLVELAKLLGPVDPDQAERIAMLFMGEEGGEHVARLWCVADALAGAAPRRAELVALEAVHAAQAENPPQLRPALITLASLSPRDAPAIVAECAEPDEALGEVIVKVSGRLDHLTASGDRGPGPLPTPEEALELLGFLLPTTATPAGSAAPRGGSPAAPVSTAPEGRLLTLFPRPSVGAVTILLFALAGVVAVVDPSAGLDARSGAPVREVPVVVLGVLAGFVFACRVVGGQAVGLAEFPDGTVAGWIGGVTFLMAWLAGVAAVVGVAAPLDGFWLGSVAATWAAVAAVWVLVVGDIWLRLRRMLRRRQVSGPGART
ncbi:serine/threonine-protein kinase [Streptomyces sp. NPDC101118]|uniref:serine/threonine-protein kinase n=1 Tax=Streptomyces sp. NPDC101118 TaxID=3366109 RepID=UPI0037F84C3E